MSIRRILDMVKDSGQIASVPEFVEEQGINMDDEEAIEVEQGEFGKPQPIARKPAMSRKTVVATVKRSISVASSQEEMIKKKKVKQVG